MPGPGRRADARARPWLPVVVPAGAIIAANGWVLPRGTRSPLFETFFWSLVVVVSFAGWGSLVRHAIAKAERVDLGLRIVWGASAACLVDGLLAAASLMARGAAFAVVEL